MTHSINLCQHGQANHFCIEGPPSRNATLGDTLAFGLIGGDVFMYNVVDTVRGPLCYRYE